MPSAFGDLNGTGNQQVWINVYRSSQDIDNNTTTYYGEVRYYGNGYGSWTNYTQYWSANFGGYTPSGTFTIPSGEAYQTYKTLWSGYFTKSHNADGTLGAFSCSASIDTDHTSIGDGTASTTEGAPPTIPRASTPSVVGGSALTTLVSATIDTNRLSTAFTHEISWSFGTLSGQTTGFASTTGITTSVVFTPPESMLAQIPNAAVGSGTITLVTKNGSTTVGSKTIAFTLTAAASVKPTISSITLADQNSTVASQVGAYVQSLSILRGTVNAAGVQGSTITDRKWSTGGITVASGADIVVPDSGTVAIGAEATDSRGRVGTFAQNITVLPYAVPLFNNVQVRRANSGGTVLDEGTYLRVDLNCQVQSLIVGTQKNSLSIKVFTRLYGTTTWTARNVINHSSVSYNTNFLISGGGIFPVNQSFDIRIEINDKFNTSAAQTIVATASVFMHWSAIGVGIGKYHEQGTLDIAGDIFANNVDVRRAATDVLNGVVELATNAETQTGTDATRVVTPAGLSSRTATETRTGILELATQAEVDAGTDAFRSLTPVTFITSLRGPVKGVIPSSIAVSSGSASSDANGLVTVTGASKISLNDVFTGPGLYEVFGSLTSSASSQVYTRMRASGTDRANTDYAMTAVWTNLSAGPTRSSGTTYSGLGFWRDTGAGSTGSMSGRLLLDVTASGPVLAVMNRLGSWNGDRVNWAESSSSAGGPFDGFTIVATSGTITGTIKVVKIS